MPQPPEIKSELLKLLNPETEPNGLTPEEFFESKLTKLLDLAKKDGLSPAELAIDLHSSRKTLFATGCWSDTYPTLRALVIRRFLPDGFEDNLRWEADERVSRDLLRLNEVLSTWAGCPENERIASARETRRNICQILKENP